MRASAPSTLPFCQPITFGPPPHPWLGRNRGRGWYGARSPRSNSHAARVFNLFHVKLAMAAVLRQASFATGWRRHWRGMISDGFKAHAARLGPKLGASLASGLTGLARRLEAARDRERAAAVARRPVVDNVTGERGGAERGPEADGGAVKPALGQSPGKKSGPRGGRPREVEGEPWKAAGVSRRTWERRRKAGGKGDG